VNFNLLGILEVDLGAERSKTVEFSFQRWVTPTQGIRAKHVLHEAYEIWEGFTVKEIRIGDEIEESEVISPFRLYKMNYGISVVRTDVEICDE
jgi:hypothetical protein